MNSLQCIGLVFLISYTHVGRSHTRRFALDNSNISNDVKPWDIIMFSQSWPITGCREWKDRNPSHTCTLPHSWIVHGVWPDYQGSHKGPQFCNKTWHFDPEQVKSIETELTEHWTNIEDGTPRYQFWAHEWNKHGTCAASVESLNSQFKYFQQGLTWNQEFNMTEILRNAGITPSNDKEYTVASVENALKSKLGVETDVQCYRHSGRNYLVELRICLNKTLQVIDCGFGDRLNEKFMTNCVGDTLIYPQTVGSLNTEKYQVDNVVDEISRCKYEVIRI